MHRWVVVAGITVLALAGCGSGGGEEVATTAQAADEKAAEDVPAEPVVLEEETIDAADGALRPSSTDIAVEGLDPEGLVDETLCEQVLTAGEIEAVVDGAVTEVDAEVNDNEFVPTVTCSYASDSPIFSLILFIGFNEGGSGRTVFDDFIADGTTTAVDGLGIAASQHVETGSYTAYVTDDIAINSVVLAVDDASAEWELALIRTAVENLTGVVAG